MAPQAPLETLNPAPLPLGEWFIRQALGLNQTRARWLIRLGLIPGRAADLGSLREAYSQVGELERRVAATGERLTRAEQNGALAWLAEIAGAGTGQPSAETRARIAGLLDRLEERRQ